MICKTQGFLTASNTDIQQKKSTRMDKIISAMTEKYFPKKTFRFSVIFIMMKTLCFHHYSTKLTVIYIFYNVYICFYALLRVLSCSNQYNHSLFWVTMLRCCIGSTIQNSPTPASLGEICSWDFMTCDYNESGIRFPICFLLITAFACFFFSFVCCNWCNSVVI